MNKYRNKRVVLETVNELTGQEETMTFASILERDTFLAIKDALKNLGLQEKIEIERQVKIEILPKNNHHKAIYYIADFVLRERKEYAPTLAIIEAKGKLTPAANLKLKMLASMLPEVYAKQLLIAVRDIQAFDNFPKAFKIKVCTLSVLEFKLKNLLSSFL